MSKKNLFKMPYLGVDLNLDYDLLYGLNGEFSVLIKICNPVFHLSGDAQGYDGYHNVFISLLKILGEGFVLQKQDIFSRVTYPYHVASEYLQDKYNRHFEGRTSICQETLMVLTKQVKINRFYVHDKSALRDFRQTVGKVIDLLTSSGFGPKVMREKEINSQVMRTIAMDFSSENIAINSFNTGDTELSIGERSVKCISLINIDQMDLPSKLGTHAYLSDKDSLKGFPVDLFSFLYRVPDFETIIFNQLIEIPSQPRTLNALELKRKRHSGIPDPANNLCVEDISLLLDDVAKENRMLVNSHFSMIMACKKEHLQKASNYLEGALFAMGIIPSKNAYNQFELFRTALPGNAIELKKYDWFLTTAEAALCFFFKESIQKDEKSKFLIRFTDRAGIPIAIDTADLPMSSGRINNRNKFVLGPSGSGKSFFMNALIEQYLMYNMDVVIVDTGHSYSGLCQYFGGKYITYSDASPITMNPFAIAEAEYNIEKKDFLATLICLIWKGAEGEVSQVERDVISNVISGYYSSYFSGKEVFMLDFNSFYEFALARIPTIKSEDKIAFDLDEFRYVLKKFYKGGEFAPILNEQADRSLFEQRLIVFEIDSIKEHKILFPIVTLIIMDVFIQKMRGREQYRKALIIEEAWKAIASPLMAGYILFLYKTVRKFWGEAVVVTQDLDDIIGNKIVKDSIISSSDTICLLDQTKFRDHYNEIASLLSITEMERRKIFSINQLDNKENRGRFKEVYIRRGAVGEVYGVEVSLAQYLTFTTEKPEKLAVEKYLSNYQNYPDAIDAFMNDLVQSGQSLGDFVTNVNNLP